MADDLTRPMPLQWEYGLPRGRRRMLARGHPETRLYPQSERGLGVADPIFAAPVRRSGIGFAVSWCALHTSSCLPTSTGGLGPPRCCSQDPA
jgi:hypothetical protein